MAIISTNSTRMGSRTGKANIKVSNILAEAYYDNFDGTSNWGGLSQAGGVATTSLGDNCIYFNTNDNANNLPIFDLGQANTNCIIYVVARITGQQSSWAVLTAVQAAASTASQGPSFLNNTSGSNWNACLYNNDYNFTVPGYNCLTDFCVCALKIENKACTWYIPNNIPRRGNCAASGRYVSFGRFYYETGHRTNIYYKYICISTTGETDAEIMDNCNQLYNQYVLRRPNVNTNTVLNNKTLLWENTSIPTLGNGWAEQDIVLNNSRKNFNFLLVEYIFGRQDNKWWYSTRLIPCDRDNFTIGGEIGGEGSTYTYVHCRDCSFTNDTTIHIYNSSWIGSGTGGRQTGGNDDVFPTRIWGV